ncbi:MAG: hypothetical protein WCV90_09020 [Candidatus Woesearchaeota archaeon]|jgi:hypothetical protein
MFNSSKIAGIYDRSLFPKVESGVTPKPSYFAEKTINQSGDVNVQIKPKDQANPLHYVIGAVIVVGLVYYASKRLD